MAQNLWLYLPKYTNKCHVMALTIIIAIKTPTPKIAETHKFASHFTRILPLFLCPFTHFYSVCFSCFCFINLKFSLKLFLEKLITFHLLEYCICGIFYRLRIEWYFHVSLYSLLFWNQLISLVLALFKFVRGSSLFQFHYAISLIT